MPNDDTDLVHGAVRKQAETDSPTGTPQPEAEQTEKRKPGAQKANRNALKHGLNRATKRTRANVQDEFDAQGRREAVKLFDKGDPRRVIYASKWAAMMRIKSRLDARGWTLPSGEIKNAVTLWRDMTNDLEKMRADHRAETTTSGDRQITIETVITFPTSEDAIRREGQNILCAVCGKTLLEDRGDTVRWYGDPHSGCCPCCARVFVSAFCHEGACSPEPTEAARAAPRPDPVKAGPVAPDGKPTLQERMTKRSKRKPAKSQPPEPETREQMLRRRWREGRDLDTGADLL